MVGTGCTVDGGLNVSRFNEPMPWIGIYIAAGSAICALAMVADAFHGVRYRKLWFPCKFFSLNATTLTLIGVAIKLSVDLNTSMPHRRDQLAKVSSSAFICTVMSNLLPSLGTTENKELLMNLMALGILVITAIVNICIQLDTGVIFAFYKEHAFLMLVMLVLLALAFSTSLAIPTTKSYLDIKCRKTLKAAIKECMEKRDASVAEKLREDLTKYWMMAYTSSPQFVIGRSATCTAAGAFTLLSFLTLGEAILTSYFMPWSFKFCKGESDYRWSSNLILVTQTVAVVVGTLAPASRWFTAVNFNCPKKASKACRPDFTVEGYWVQKLIEWKEQPLNLKGRRFRKHAHNVKNLILDVCIGAQKGVVLMSKLLRFISIFFVSCFLKSKGWIKCNTSVSSNHSETDSQSCSIRNLSRYVMHLGGEEGLVHLMTENNLDATYHWIGIGRKKQPKNLIKFLERACSSQEFEGVREFDSKRIPSLHYEEPPNCWALPVVTLTSIAISIPNIESQLVEHLVGSVHEGLACVREVEDKLDEKLDLRNTRKAAEVVWLGVDLYRKWLDVDLREIAVQQKNGRAVLEQLSDKAKAIFMEFKKDEPQMNGCLREMPSRWPIKLMAANSMYRICQTILLDYHHNDNNEKLFDKLTISISRILKACFTNLPQVISTNCHRSTIEEREGSIRHAVLLFGKTEKVLGIVDRTTPELPDIYRLVHIDDWHLYRKETDSTNSDSNLPDEEDEDADGIRPPELFISVE